MRKVTLKDFNYTNEMILALTEIENVLNSNGITGAGAEPVALAQKIKERAYQEKISENEALINTLNEFKQDPDSAIEKLLP